MHAKGGECELVAQGTKAILNELDFARSIIGSITTPFVVVDTEETLCITNQGLLGILGQSGKPEDYYGWNVAEFFYGDRNRKTVLSTAMQDKRGIRKEVDFSSRDGRTLNIQIDAMPLFREKDKAVLGAICIYLDVSELRKKEAEICDQNELISRAAERATAVADNLANEADQLAAQVEQTRASTDEQRNRTSEVAGATQQMSASIMENADNARSVTELAENSRTKAGEGAAEVERTRKVILEVRDEASALRDDMTQLSEHAVRIGDVMNVINDIADQTNLLALNAAIEAARAGEAGRGFAVVADEVRKLAEKTMQATKEVGEVVRAIQTSAEKSQTSTESAVASVMRGVESSTTAGEKIQEILAIIEQTTDRVHGIAEAVAQQSMASDQVSEATNHILSSAEETAAAMDESARAVSELARMASELKSIIKDMKTQSHLEECEPEAVLAAAAARRN
ncbi:methyl-accepting chemotaxis protein [Oceanidesulfovibrio marinus]|uniref:methyl-accepting chemotaxis protein n=1 Tax=Oceanidesulfovibrio marinus TaxID=370038 RepID=UPI001ABF108D|nr:methyl-accepting chemotaxis protein [Oceanidesulfovibrio marinus]